MSMDSLKLSALKIYQAIEAYPAVWNETVRNASKPLKTIDTLIQQLDCVLRTPPCTLNKKCTLLSGGLEIIIRNHIHEELASIQLVLDEMSTLNNKLKASYESALRLYTENKQQVHHDPTTFYYGSCFSPPSSLIIEQIEDMLLYYSNKLSSAKYAFETFDYTAPSLSNIQAILDSEDDAFSLKLAAVISTSFT